MGRKRFDKKKAATFHVVHRPDAGLVPGASPFMLQQSGRPDQGEIPADFPQELLAQPMSEYDQYELQMKRMQQMRADVLGEDDGLMPHEYDYSQHLRPIGQGKFMGAEGADEVLMAAREAGEMAPEADDLYVDPANVIEPVAGKVRATNDFYEALEGGEEHAGKFEEILDDFVITANISGSDDDEDEDGGQEGWREGDEEPDFTESEDEDEQQDDDDDEARQQRVLDAQFERMMSEYNEEDIGELYEDDPELLGAVEDTSRYDGEIDGFMNRKERLGFVPGDLEAEEDERERQQKELLNARAEQSNDAAARLAEEKAARAPKVQKAKDAKEATLAAVNPLLQRLSEQPEDARSIALGIESMFSARVREMWDCESIVSTYSNTENHPSVVPRPNRALMKLHRLSRKTGIPVTQLIEKLARTKLKGVESLHAGAKAKVEEEEEEEAAQESGVARGDDEDDGDYEDEEEDEEEEEYTVQVNQGEKRNKKETKAEKKARKQAVKAERRRNRERKKEIKLMYKSEGVRQSKLDVANRKANQAGLRLD